MKFDKLRQLKHFFTKPAETTKKIAKRSEMTQNFKIGEI